MKIAFFTEAGFEGKVPRSYNNIRTEYAWQIALNSDHYNIHQHDVSQEYDLGIIIISKTNPMFDLDDIKQTCKKVAVMQEGPHWNFQDYPLEQQIWYYNILVSVDLIFCHNESDVVYYRGLTNKPTYVMKSLMITDNVTQKEQEEKVIIGGNMVSWYGGFDSWIVSQEFNLPISAPSMGRKQDREDELDINYLPYMNWVDWMSELSTYKYAVHLMRTHAAGTFALNCAYWKIPCVGYRGLDTQEILHPHTTVSMGDLEEARGIVKKLKNPDFYKTCQDAIKKRYDRYYTECVWVENWKGYWK